MSDSIKSAGEIRESFIDFFRDKDHLEFPSAPLVPPNDPTLLFTSAGMVQFKDYYMNPDQAEHPRAVTVQKCLRAGDLESVGKTLRHHTFFEMLGNFSFGDYFKKEAIQWAWEYVRDIIKLPPERIYVSIYEDDEEAFTIWNQDIGIEKDRIYRLGKKDNFWGPVGETGICGPCTELYYDMGEKVGCGRPGCAPGCDCDRYLEFWNLVFPQYWMNESGEYEELEKPGIDTGLGLERLATILQGAEDNYHSDLFLPIVQRIREILPSSAGTDHPGKAMSVNMIADHIRALTFALAEGIYPSNEGRGYCLRRILRRALTRIYIFGLEQPCLYRGVETVVSLMKDVYPELKEREPEIVKVIRAEEESFFNTLQRGRDRFSSLVEKVKSAGETVISGEDIFVLYDTYGFPYELTGYLASGAGLELDEEGFHREMEIQREKAQQSSCFDAGDREKVPMRELSRGEDSVFTGYDTLEEEAVLRKFREADEEAYQGVDWQGAGPAYEMVFDRTPFYAAAGGQVADSGRVLFGDRAAAVRDVFRREGSIIHLVEFGEDIKDPGSLLESCSPVHLEVDREARTRTAANHTATHLLHSALKSVLGRHVAQAGSFVSPGRFRFDFNHFEAISDSERLQIEDLVNKWIRDCLEVRTEITSYSEAVQSGVTALFGEKYGTGVRVVRTGDVSAELCGGTHIDITGRIGLFVIVDESSIAAGVRRIEGLTGEKAVNYLREYQSVTSDAAELLRVPHGEIKSKIESILDETGHLRKKIKKIQSGDISGRIDRIIEQAERIDDILVATGRIDVDSVSALRDQADRFRNKVGRGVAVLSRAPGEKLEFVIAVTDSLIDKGIDANILVKRLSRVSGGGGGGKKHLAQLGTRNTDVEKAVFASVPEIIREMI
ncbi:MAG: alanine--tRNA ligase [Candidatus Krumholzibacteriales bacterium]